MNGADKYRRFTELHIAGRWKGKALPMRLKPNVRTVVHGKEKKSKTVLFRLARSMSFDHINVIGEKKRHPIGVLGKNDRNEWNYMSINEKDMKTRILILVIIINILVLISILLTSKQGNEYGLKGGIEWQDARKTRYVTWRRFARSDDCRPNGNLTGLSAVTLRISESVKCIIWLKTFSALSSGQPFLR